MMKYSDGPIANSLSVLWDYIVLVSLMVVISLPLITFGVSFHAALRVLDDFEEETHSFVVSIRFFHYLREQWLWYSASTILVLMSLFMSAVNLKMIFDGDQHNIMVAILTCVLAILVVGAFMSIQVVGVRMHLAPMMSLRTAMMFFVLNLPQNLLILVVTSGLLYLEAVMPLSFLIVVVLLCVLWRKFLAQSRTMVTRAHEVVQ